MEGVPQFQVLGMKTLTMVPNHWRRPLGAHHPPSGSRNIPSSFLWLFGANLGSHFFSPDVSSSPETTEERGAKMRNLGCSIAAKAFQQK